MRIADSVVEQVRDRSDIVEVVREYVPALKAAGRNHKACCPFHQERTPSFNVNPEKQIYHCFGCGAGGDVFSFVMKLEGLAFLEAVAKLGERLGIRVEPEERELSPAERERIGGRKALEAAREHYHKLLMTSPEAEEARQVLKKRGVSPEMTDAWGLGFAPRSGGIGLALTKLGIGAPALLRAGLIVKREDRMREMFWARLLFPIRNGKGETVGFGGRVLGEGEPKYLNTSETDYFSKGKVLYGMHEALPALRRERKALVLEGYMDVIALHQFGFTNAVAPLGTALTEDHAALLKRWVDSVVIVFDPDAAGSSAAVKSAELLLEKGFSVAVATIPDGLDPDELLHQRGAAAFRSLLDAAVDLPEFKTRVLMSRFTGALSHEDKAKVAGQVLETIRKCPDDVLKGEWITRLSQILSVNESTLLSQLAKGVHAAPDRALSRGSAASKALGAAAPKAAVPVDDREVLLALLRMPQLAAGGLVEEADFADPRSRGVFRRLLALLAEGRPREGWTARMLEGLSDDEAGAARELLCDARELRDPEKLVAEVVGRARKARRLKELEPLVLGAAGGGAVDPGLRDEYRRLLSDLKGMKRG
ncbi:MAG: DNA primase [Elusimicrobia bacterium]|nr:DNA primase [Elusimicrobiota bacterium]